MFNHLAGLSDVSDLQSAVVCKLTLTSHTGVSYWFSGPKKKLMCFLVYSLMLSVNVFCGGG